MIDRENLIKRIYTLGNALEKANLEVIRLQREFSLRVVEQATGEALKEEKNPAAVSLGRLGGLKGGKARASKLSAGERKRIAQQAAKTRWTKAKIKLDYTGDHSE